MAALNPREMELLDAIHAAAASLLIPALEAPRAIWRVAMYGGAVVGEDGDSRPSAWARDALQHALDLSDEIGSWVRRDDDGEAEAVSLSHWTSEVPTLALVAFGGEVRDRFPPTGAMRPTGGPVHAYVRDPHVMKHQTLCASGLAVEESQGRLHELPLPSARDDWCVTCLQRTAALFASPTPARRPFC